MFTRLLASAAPGGTHVHIPGTSLVQGLATAGVGLVLSLCVLGLLLSVGAMAVGSHSNNGRLADRGRTGAIASLIGAVVAGGAFALINFAFASGGKIH